MTRDEAAAIMRQWLDEAAARIEPLRSARNLRLAVALDEARIRQVALLESTIMGRRGSTAIDLDDLARFADQMGQMARVTVRVGKHIKPGEISAAIWVGLEAVLLGLEDG